MISPNSLLVWRLFANPHFCRFYFKSLLNSSKLWSSLLAVSTFLFLAGPALSVPSGSLAKRESRTTAPAGCITVGSEGNYTTIASALETFDADSTDAACVFIEPGTYEEQIVVEYGGPMTFYGSTEDTTSYEANTVTITHNLSAGESGSGEASATLDIISEGFKLYNINVVNSYGEGSQAIA